MNTLNQEQVVSHMTFNPASPSQEKDVYEENMSLKKQNEVYLREKLK